METGKAIFNLLQNDATLGAIIGDRIYPELAQQDQDAPFVVYTVTDTTPAGTKTSSSTIDVSEVDIYCISKDYEQCMDIGIAVRNALDRNGGSLSGVEVQSIDFLSSDVDFDTDQRAYILDQNYNVRVMRVGQAPDITMGTTTSVITVKEVDGAPSGLVTTLIVSDGTLTIDGDEATITTGGGGASTQYHDRYSTAAETERSGATANVELYYTARPDGDGLAESATSDAGVTDTINRTLYYSTKYRADADTAGDWTAYTTQPADDATYATARAAILVGLNDTDATAETRGTLPLSLKIVRTTTAPSTDLLLDTYPGSAAAYSVRKLAKDFSGYSMRVRRSSDEATQDIGFDSNGDLDTAAIATFVGDAFGYVTRWYDQSGNANDATQNTSADQPMIYDRAAAAVILENGKPAVQFDGVSNKILSPDLGLSSTDFCIAATCKILGSQDTLYSLGYSYPTNGMLYRTQNSGTNTIMFFDGPSETSVSTTLNASSQTLHFINFNGGSFDVYGNGANKASATSVYALGDDILHLGVNSGNNSYFLSGTLQEFIIYDVEQSTNRTGIETNINTEFSIYT